MTPNGVQLFVLFILWSWIALKFSYAHILIVGIDRQDIIFLQMVVGLMAQCTLAFYIVFNAIFDGSSCSVWLE